MFQSEFNKGSMLVTGGAKSGKSTFALDVCEKSGKNKVFLATAQAMDSEMEERIKRHKQDRGDQWLTLEEPINVVDAIDRIDREETIILFDCLTLWVNNLYMKHPNERAAIEYEIERLLKRLHEIKGMIVIVSNEVGCGIVPENVMARAYRDDVGLLNQRIARLSSKVVTVIAGIPLVLKDD